MRNELEDWLADNVYTEIKAKALQELQHQARYWQALEQLVVDEGFVKTIHLKLENYIFARELEEIRDELIKRAKEMVDG